jgi:hypothetical protein
MLIACASILTLEPIPYRLKGKVTTYRWRSKEDGSSQISGQSRGNQCTLITFDGRSQKMELTVNQGQLDCSSHYLIGFRELG